MQAAAAWNAQHINAGADDFRYEGAVQDAGFTDLQEGRSARPGARTGVCRTIGSFPPPSMPEMTPAYPLLNAAGKVVSVAPMMDWTYVS